MYIISYSPLDEVVLRRELQLPEVGTHSGQGVLKEDLEGVEVRSHEGVVHLEEGEVGRSVEQVGQTDERVCCLHVQ